MITIYRKKDKKLRKSKLPVLTVNMWLEAVREAKQEIEEPIPEGYLTIEQLKDVFGLCKSKAFGMVKKLEEAGKCQRLKVRRIKTNGKLRIVGVYKLICK
jgi:hypothetical protein